MNHAETTNLDFYSIWKHKLGNIELAIVNDFNASIKIPPRLLGGI